MSRQVGNRSEVVAVVLSLALHGLLGIGLFVQFSRSPAAVPPRLAPPTAMAVLQEDEPVECRMYLVPEPPSKPHRAERKSPTIAPREEPVPLPTFVALPPNLSSTEMRPQQQLPPAHQRPGGMGATFFGLPTPAQAKKIVYLLDRSGSMGQNSLLKRASRELLDSLEKLTPTTEFQVLVYNSNVEPLPRPLLQWRVASAENRRLVELGLQVLSAEGGTDHLPALRRAIGLRPDLIFFVTDADDLTEEQVRLATEWNAGKSVICTIELNLANHQHELMPLRQLARRNGGLYQAVDPEKLEPLRGN